VVGAGLRLRPDGSEAGLPFLKVEQRGSYRELRVGCYNGSPQR